MLFAPLAVESTGERLDSELNACFKKKKISCFRAADIVYSLDCNVLLITSKPSEPPLKNNCVLQL